jgi:hypothetical protein
MSSNPQDSYHLISTDNFLFEKLGLSVFTTGSFLEFWNYKKPNDKSFIHRNYFDYSSPNVGFIFKALSSNLCSADIYDIGSNSYSLMNDIWNTWSLTNKQLNTYDISNIPFGSFTDKTCSSISNLGTLTNWTKDTVGHPPRMVTMSDLFGADGEKIAKVIEMNNWIIHKKVKEGQKNIEEWVSEGSFSQDDAIAINTFVGSLKSSKTGYVEWASNVRFNLTPGFPYGDPRRCVKTEKVKFKLRLYDHKIPRDQRRSIVQKGPLTNVGVPAFEFGPNGKRSDGLPVDEVTETVQPLDVIVDSISGKGRSGSLQVIAKLTTDVESAKDSLFVDELLKMDANAPEFSIDNVTSKFKPSTGKAMPLQAQNKNPNQWTPVWSNQKCNNNTNNKPTEVNVYNFSKRTYKKGATVLLNQLGGTPSQGIVWAIIDFGEEPETPTSQVFEGRWDFTQLISNGDGFFRKFRNDSGPLTPLNDGAFDKFTPEEYETEFRASYYNKYLDDAKKNRDVVKSLDASENGATTPVTPVKFLVNSNAYWQMTSWDFLHSSIGGTRGKYNSLGTTVAELHPGGKTWAEAKNPPSDNQGDEDPTTKWGFDASPFFGAVFPDGYNIDNITGKRIEPSTKEDYRAAAGVQDFKFLSVTADKKTRELWDLNYTTPKEPTADGKKASPFNDSISSFVYRAYDKGIFDSIIINGGAKMLPADIALHASPNGKNGRPISSMYWMKGYMTLEGINADTYFTNWNSDPTLNSLIHNQPARYAWFAKVVTENGTDKMYESFDLLPRKRKLQFRPLFAETYFTFGPNNRSLITDNEQEPLKNMLWMSERGHSHQTFGGIAAAPVMGKQFLTRNDQDNNTPARYISLGRGPIPTLGTNGYGLLAGRHQKFGGGYNAASEKHNGQLAGIYNTNVWGTANSPYGGNPNGVGIICAVCTVKSVGINSISFSVDCNIGTSAKTNNSLGGAFNNLSTFFGIVSVGPTFSAGDIFYWGGNDNPWNFNTTTCHAKIYHAWPRELTVYDARFFVVHHFNYGVNDYKIVRQIHHAGLPVKNENLPEGLKVAAAGPTNPADFLVNNNKLWAADTGSLIANTSDSNGLVGETGVYYPVDTITYKEADYREPTYNNKDANIDGSSVEPGYVIFKDSPLRHKDQWRVNIKTRGMLLPFKHLKRTIGIGSVNDVISATLRSTVNGRDVSDPNIRIIIADASPQSGYLTGDTFTTSGGSGKSVVLEVSAVSAGGAVASFKIIDPGYGFSHSDFMSKLASDGSSAKFNNNSTSAVSLKPLNIKGLGKGLKGWIVKGLVININSEVKKPEMCGSDLISPPTKTSSIITLNNFKRSISWNPELASSDNRYDIMLWFHNDIAHTVQYSDYGWFGVARQQWITVTPLPE